MFVLFPNELIKWALIYRICWPVNLRDPNRPWHHGNFFPYIKHKLPSLLCAHCLFSHQRGSLKGYDFSWQPPNWYWKPAIRTPEPLLQAGQTHFPQPLLVGQVCAPLRPPHCIANGPPQVSHHSSCIWSIVCPNQDTVSQIHSERRQEKGKKTLPLIYWWCSC